MALPRNGTALKHSWAEEAGGQKGEEIELNYNTIVSI
jgi:hypothetical protein